MTMLNGQLVGRSMPQVVNEEPTHFEVSDGQSTFKVPKSGLSESLQQRIRSMSAPGVSGASFQPAANPEPLPPESVMSMELPPGGQGVNSGGGGGGSGAGGGGAGSESLVMDPTRGGMVRDTGQGAQGGGHAPQPTYEPSRVADMKDLPPSLRLKGAPETSVPPPAMVTPPLAAPVRPSGGMGGGLPGVGAFNRGNTDEQKAIQAEGEAEAAKSRATANALVEGDNVLQQHELAQKEIFARSRAGADDAMRKFQSAVTDVNNADTTVDSGRYWASRSTAGKIAGIIGLALGSLSPDGVNKSANLLNQAIDREIDAQKAEHSLRLQKGKQAVDAAQSLYGMNHQIFQNDLAAEAATRAAAMSRVENSLKRVEVASASPIAKARAAELMAKLQQERGKFESQAANIAFDNHVKLMTAKAPGNGGISPAEAKELHGAEAAAQNSLDFIGKIRQGLKETSSPIPGKTALNQNVGQDAATLGVNQTGLLLELKNLAKLGVLSKSDEGILDKLTGDPQAIFTTERTKGATLNALESMVKRSIENQRRAAGGAQAQSR